MKRHFWLKLLSSSLLIITGCGNNSATTSSDKVGYLIDAAVQGVEYRCGDKIDLTASDGKFICPTLPVSFFIGSLNLGSISDIPTDTKVFPQDIIGVGRDKLNNSEVLKLATLLQSLDSDNNASNGITITSALRNSFNQENETVLTNVTLEELQQLYPTLHLVNETEAMEHLTTSTNSGGNTTSNELNTTTPTANMDTTNEETTTLKLPEGYNYRMINNQGIAVESKLDNYTIKLYSNYNETISPQSRHSGVVVKINEEVGENIAIQATYLGKSMVVAVYNERNELVIVSDIIEVIDVPVIVVTLSK
ncbi:hypothetical protein KKC13_03385 [bacterium]|nr:hypothetical protein [bacterium]MBU1957390.1 hypothetical protein [bacterium]